MIPTAKSPDCRDGNDRKCDGKAWDDNRDCISVCECPCHYNLKDAS